MYKMTEINITIQSFLKAFSDLDLIEMMKFFSNDATSFLPVVHHHNRLNSKIEINKAFQKVITRIKSSGKNEIQLKAEDLKIKKMGNSAIVTFHLYNNDLCRRTLVFRKKEGSWLIEHLHASNASYYEGQNER
jgi:ketosteroid isomerase-like protein